MSLGLLLFCVLTDELGHADDGSLLIKPSLGHPASTRPPAPFAVSLHPRWTDAPFDLARIAPFGLVEDLAIVLADHS
jgi:hypothetical protein